jgi:hypothetical protein
MACHVRSVKNPTAVMLATAITTAIARMRNSPERQSRLKNRKEKVTVFITDI